MFCHSQWLTKPILVLWLMTSLAAAAEPPPAASPTAQPKPVIAIPLAEIAPRADQAIRRLNEIEKMLDRDTIVETVEDALLPLSERIDTWLKLRWKQIERVSSVMDLNDLRRNWQQFTTQLNDLEGQLERGSERVGRLQKEVDEILDAWKATGIAAARKALPRLIRQRVELVIRVTTALDSKLQERTTQLLSVGNRIDAQQNKLAEFGKHIEKKSQSLGRDLFMLDSVPLWRLFGEESGDESLPGQATIAWQLLTSEIQIFLEDYRSRLRLHVVLILLCMALLLWSRRSFMSEVAEEGPASPGVQVLRHPLSSAGFLFLVTAFWLYPGTTVDIGRVILFLTILPSIWLGPALVPALWGKPVYVLISFYCLEFFRLLLPPGALSDRVLLLLLDMGAAGYCAKQVFFHKERFAGLTGIGTILSELLLLVALLTGIAAGSNVLGNLSLANVLTTTTIRLAYLGLVLYVCGELLSVLIAFVLRTRFARLSLLVRKNGPLLVSRWRRTVRFLVLVLWLLAFFYYLGMLGGLFSTGSDFLTRKWQIGATQISLADVLTFALVFSIALYLSRFLRFVFREEFLPRVRFPRGVPGAIDMLSNYVILILGFLLALAAAGVDLSKVTLVVGALGVGLGFGLQNMVSNFVSGLILAFEHPIEVGDVVETGSHFGEVRKIGFRASVVCTFDGAEVIIPNGELVWGRVINWSLSDRVRRVEIPVGAAYGTDPQRVLDILQDVALKHPNVLRTPPPGAFFERFGDSSLDFILRAWVTLDDFLRVRSDLTVAVNSAFKEAGVQIPFPQRDLHIDWPDTSVSPRSNETGG